MIAAVRVVAAPMECKAAAVQRLVHARLGRVGFANHRDAAFKRIKAAALSRQMLALTGQLATLALAKKPAAVKRVVNHTLNA